MSAALAKARINVDSTKGSNFGGTQITTDQMSRLWLYPWVVYKH